MGLVTGMKIVVDWWENNKLIGLFFNKGVGAPYLEGVRIFDKKTKKLTFIFPTVIMSITKDVRVFPLKRFIIPSLLREAINILKNALNGVIDNNVAVSFITPDGICVFNTEEFRCGDVGSKAILMASPYILPISALCLKPLNQELEERLKVKMREVIESSIET
jgi:hypothetical protein